MKLWAIANKYQEDVFVDFKKMEDSIGLEETSFVPTKEMAEEFIEDRLSIDYVPVEHELISYRAGIMETTRIGNVDEWDKVRD